MSLISIHIHCDVAEIEKKLDKIISFNKHIMATFSEIRTEFDTLKQAIADERTQILAKIQELEDTINSGNGGTVEERAALLEELKGQVAAVKEIIPDPTELPETPGEETPA